MLTILNRLAGGVVAYFTIGSLIWLAIYVGEKL